jgi:hypothetical protein
MKQRMKLAGILTLALAGFLATGALAQGHKLHALQFSRAQQEQALAVARSAQPIVRELRQQIRAERGQGREHVRELVRGAFERLQPQVHALIATLTPEQRAQLEARAQRRGRTLDEARLERRLAFLLSRPGAAQRIERRLER